MNLTRPCLIIDDLQVLCAAVAQRVVPQGHEHSEDIIRDPRVAQLADQRAAEYEPLADAERIQGPKSRWYHERRASISLLQDSMWATIHARDSGGNGKGV